MLPEDILKNLATQGILGIFCVILIIVCYRLFTLLISEKDGRRLDAEKVRDSVMEPLKEMKRTLDLIFDKVKDDK